MGRGEGLLTPRTPRGGKAAASDEDTEKKPKGILGSLTPRGLRKKEEAPAQATPDVEKALPSQTSATTSEPATVQQMKPKPQPVKKDPAVAAWEEAIPQSKQTKWQEFTGEDWSGDIGKRVVVKDSKGCQFATLKGIRNAPWDLELTLEDGSSLYRGGDTLATVEVRIVKEHHGIHSIDDAKQAAIAYEQAVEAKVKEVGQSVKDVVASTEYKPLGGEPEIDEEGNKIYINPETGKKVKRLKAKNAERIQAFIDKAADKTIKDDKAKETVKKCGPVLSFILKVFLFVAPLYVRLYRILFLLWLLLPKQLATAIFGFFLCFTGGRYFAVFAAIEAFRQLGWKQFQDNMEIVMKEAQIVFRESELDDLKDDDDDGIADVDQISPQELAQRKMGLALRSIEDPNQLQASFGILYGGWLSVIATLQLQFARITAIALGIAEMLKPRAIQFGAPILVRFWSKEYHHWIESTISTTLTIICVWTAFFVQRFISGFYSALRGGLLFSRGLMLFIGKRTCCGRTFGVSVEEEFDETIADEVIGYSMAAAGFTYQVMTLFHNPLPFPLSLTLLPVDIVEFYIEWQIAFGDSPAGKA